MLGYHLRSLGTSPYGTYQAYLTYPSKVPLSFMLFSSRHAPSIWPMAQAAPSPLGLPIPPLRLSPPMEYASTPPGPKVSSSGPGLGQLSMYFGCLRFVRAVAV